MIYCITIYYIFLFYHLLPFNRAFITVFITSFITIRNLGIFITIYSIYYKWYFFWQIFHYYNFFHLLPGQLGDVTVNSDGSKQNFGNNLLHESESIVAKVCSQKCSKWKTMSESQVEICIDWTAFDFSSYFKDFFEQSAMKKIIHCVIDQSSLAQSWSLGWRSVLNFKFSFLAFLRFMTCPMNIAQKMCTKKIFQIQSM